MSNLRLIHAGVLTSSLIAWAGMPLPAVADGEDTQAVPAAVDSQPWMAPEGPWLDSMPATHHLRGPVLLQLHISRNLYEYPAEVRSQKNREISSELVRQIDMVRTQVPSWRGLSHLAPGGSGVLQ